MNTSFCCLLCESRGSFEVESNVLRDDTSGRFQVIRRLTCGHVQLFPLPSDKQEAAFYDSDQQARGSLDEVDLSLMERKSSADTQRRVRWVSSAVQGGEVLDIGCGYGFFVDALTKAGYRVSGVDVSRERLEFARTNLQGSFMQVSIDARYIRANRGKYGVVTLFHVLEHIRNPVQFLQQCSEMVRSDGMLLIEVPNLDDGLLDEIPEYRAFFWQRAHLSYFDAAHLKLALHRAGLTNFAIRGIQRYGLQNLLHWLDRGEPQLYDPDFKAEQPMLRRLEELYRQHRVAALKCDTLTVEVFK